jgi:hypothetical protein
MPTDTITIEDLKKRNDDTAKDYQEALKQQEANRLNSPATKGDVERLTKLVEGQHWQIQNLNKTNEDFRTSFNQLSDRHNEKCDKNHELQRKLTSRENLISLYIGILCAVTIVLIVADWLK